VRCQLATQRLQDWVHRQLDYSCRYPRQEYRLLPGLLRFGRRQLLFRLHECQLVSPMVQSQGLRFRWNEWSTVSMWKHFAFDRCCPSYLLASLYRKLDPDLWFIEWICRCLVSLQCLCRQPVHDPRQQGLHGLLDRWIRPTLDRLCVLLQLFDSGYLRHQLCCQ
jgi:hypothetical protein